MPHGSVFGPILFLLYTSELFSILDNNLIGDAKYDEYTLLSVVPSPGARVKIVKSLSRALGKVSDRCDLCGMKLNASITKNDSLMVTHPAELR